MSIRERILARRDLDALRAARDITKLAEALNAEGIVAPCERFATARAIVTMCPSGRSIMSKLKAAATEDVAVEIALDFLKQEAGLNLGSPEAIAFLAQLVKENVLTSAERDEIVALTLRPVIVTQAEVAAEMYTLEGIEK